MSRRRTGWRWPALLALVGAVGVPAIAEAQLLPNLPARKRVKSECCAEDPMFRMYRQQYYGYWPTCWRMWAPGWGCPSPAAPNSAQAIEEIRQELMRQPEEAPPEGMPPAAGTETAPTPRPETPDTGLPALPREPSSPFNLDRPGTRPGAAPGTSPGPVPNTNPPPVEPAPSATPGGGTTNPGTSESADAAAPETAHPSPLTLLDVGDHPSSTTGPNPGVTAVLPPADDPQPLPAPAAPDPNAVGTPMVQPGGMPLGVAPPPPPMQAPQRRGLLGNLFQNWGWRRR